MLANEFLHGFREAFDSSARIANLYELKRETHDTIGGTRWTQANGRGNGQGG
jgi:hypothetical protein